MATKKRKMPEAFIKQQEKMKAKAARKHDSTSRPAKPGSKRGKGPRKVNNRRKGR